LGVVQSKTYTKERIKKYYKKDAVVIYPPTETKKFIVESLKPIDQTDSTLANTSASRTNKIETDYWLSVNRIVRHKRIEIQIDAFKKLPEEKLVIVGSYEKEAEQFETYKDEIEKAKTDNVRILNWVDNTELTRLYKNCKGFITTATAEDFGMTAVEAMSAGKFVIAPNEGGYKESILDGKTGTLIDTIDSEKLITAICKVSDELKRNPSLYKEASQKRASEFDTSVFIAKIKALLN
jgi:glycosyltransferase involved in cell wall biosynthesis